MDCLIDWIESHFWMRHVWNAGCLRMCEYIYIYIYAYDKYKYVEWGSIYFGVESTACGWFPKKKLISLQRWRLPTLARLYWVMSSCVAYNSLKIRVSTVNHLRNGVLKFKLDGGPHEAKWVWLTLVHVTMQNEFQSKFRSILLWWFTHRYGQKMINNKISRCAIQKSQPNIQRNCWILSHSIPATSNRGYASRFVCQHRPTVPLPRNSLTPISWRVKTSLDPFDISATCSCG